MENNTQQNTPPPDTKVEEGKPITFDEFVKLTGEDFTPTVEPKSDETLQTKPPLKEDGKKDDTKPEDKSETVKVEDKKPEQQQQHPVPNKDKEDSAIVEEVSKDIRTGKKDYTDIPEEDIPIFSKMGQKSFEHLKPIYLEHKKQKALLEQQAAEISKLKEGALPDNYFAHPRGYTLSREFENAAGLYTKAQQAAEFWKEQLDRIEKGEQTYQEIHVNQNGEFYFTKPIIATKETADELKTNIKHVEQQVMKHGASLQVMAEAHKARFDEAVKLVKDFENESFVNFNGENAAKLEPIVQDTIRKILPATFHNNPLASTLAKSLLTVRQLGAIIKDLEAKGAKPANGDNKSGQPAAKPTSDQSKAGPTVKSMSSGDSNSNENISYNDYQEYTSRR